MNPSPFYTVTCHGRQRCSLDALPNLKASPVPTRWNGNLIALTKLRESAVRKAELGRKLLHRP